MSKWDDIIIDEHNNKIKEEIEEIAWQNLKNILLK